MTDFKPKKTVKRGRHEDTSQGYGNNFDLLASRGMVYTEAEGKRDFGRGIYTENPDLDRHVKATKAPSVRKEVTKAGKPKPVDKTSVAMKKAAEIAHRLSVRLARHSRWPNKEKKDDPV